MFSVIFVVAAGVILYKTVFNTSHQTITATTQSEDIHETKVDISDKSYDQYSFEDLKYIASQLKDATGEQRSQIAQAYHLIDEAGNLNPQTLSVRLNDGRTLEFRLAGICQDEGSGLTFITNAYPDKHEMNPSSVKDGGWKSCSMRSWLQEDVYANLPQDMQNALVAVNKTTNAGDAQGGARYNASGSLQTTQDTLWLPSASEVCGTIDWFTKDDVFDNSKLNANMSGQGNQYQIFSEHGIQSKKDPEGFLTTFNKGKGGWWYRSPYAFSYDFMDSSFWYSVMDSGFPFAYFHPQDQMACVFGFCI